MKDKEKIRQSDKKKTQREDKVERGINDNDKRTG
jgi:hypothetical protein